MSDIGKSSSSSFLFVIRGLCYFCLSTIIFISFMFDDTFIYVSDIKEWLNRNYVNRSKCQSIVRIASSKAYHDMIDFIDTYIMKDVL